MPDTVFVGEKKWYFLSPIILPGPNKSGIWLGNCKDACNFDDLKEKQIKAIANCTEDLGFTAKALESDLALEAGEDVFVLGYEDCVALPRYTIEAFCRWMDKHVNSNHNIVIHCHAGISRSPSLLIAWLMWSNGVTYQSNLNAEWNKWEKLVHEIRPIIRPHHEVKKSIINFFKGLTADEKAARS